MKNSITLILLFTSQLTSASDKTTPNNPGDVATKTPVWSIAYYTSETDTLSSAQANKDLNSLMSHLNSSESEIKKIFERMESIHKRSLFHTKEYEPTNKYMQKLSSKYSLIVKHIKDVVNAARPPESSQPQLNQSSPSATIVADAGAASKK